MALGAGCRLCTVVSALLQRRVVIVAKQRQQRSGTRLTWAMYASQSCACFQRVVAAILQGELADGGGAAHSRRCRTHILAVSFLRAKLCVLNVGQVCIL